jgi:hypothetical protein
MNRQLEEGEKGGYVGLILRKGGRGASMRGGAVSYLPGSTTKGEPYT